MVHLKQHGADLAQRKREDEKMRIIENLILALLLALSTTACGGEGQSAPSAAPAEGALDVHYIDVGQADSALILCGGESMLIDGGNVADSSLVVSYLADQGVDSLDYVVCTHAHEDHVGGLSGPLSQYPAEHVLAPVTEYDTKAFQNFLKYTRQQGLEVTSPSPGDTWTVGDASVTVLGPQKAYEDTNNTSIVLRLDYGETSFLFTGDAERDAEADMLEAGAALQADVLKVGHHGSNTSTSYPFLREVAPEYAVISVGEGNDYGHPHEETMSRLRDADVTVYRTDLQGHIVATSDGESISFAVQKNAGVPTNPTQGAQADHYIGNINSKVFHRPDCSGLPAERNQVEFANRTDAVNAGYTPCGRCKP